MVLGKISQINRYDIALAMPNNLTGYVPLTSISDKVTEIVEALAANDQMSDNEEDSEILDLKSFFTVGQYLRAYVTSTHDESASGGKGRRHIELSIHPYQTNKGLSKANIVANCMVQASVSSVEDHGLIMNVGLEDTSVRGFMSLKEVEINTVLSKVKRGSVYLCLVTGLSSNGNVIKLSSDTHKAGDIKKKCFLADAPNINSFLPGVAVEFLVSNITSSGIAGKVMGLLDVTADLIHSGAALGGKDLEKKYKIGSKAKGRVICTFPTVEEGKLGLSLLEHIIFLKSASPKSTFKETAPTTVLPISTILEEAQVVKVEPDVGLFLDIGIKGMRGFVHISKVADGKVESLSESIGQYKVGSLHKARIIGYNSVDGLFIVSLEPKVINQKYLRLEDVKAGDVAKGTIEKIMVNESGVNGILVNIGEGITGLVPEIHFADIRLEYPERKFKEGSLVKARILSTNPDKRQLRLTLKKSLVNSDAKIWDSYESLQPGLQAPGTLVNVSNSGAVVQFFGSVRGFLPVSEMSESYIQDPKQHFRVGQVVNVHIVSVDIAERRMIVSCKDLSAFGSVQRKAFEEIKFGVLVEGTVSQKTGDEVVLELKGSGLKALLPFEHLTDGSSQKCQSQAKKLRINQTLKDLLVLYKHEKTHLIKVTNKPSLLKAAKDGDLLSSFSEIVEGNETYGYVKNITEIGVFVQFGADITGLLLKAHIPDELALLPDFGMRRHQSITSRILTVDHQNQRFLLTLKPIPANSAEKNKSLETLPSSNKPLLNAVDEANTSIDDLIVGKLTKAKIMSIKATQLNVQLADGVQGRVDVSEAFDTLEDIKNVKHPLENFHVQQIISVKVLGMHDTRNHRFLPITNRGKSHVFELSAKPSTQTESDLDILTVDKAEVGSFKLVFVNNIVNEYVWVSLSPNVRGRIRALDISDEISLLDDLKNNFPIGSALKARIVNVDIANNRLDLSMRSGSSTSSLTMNDVAPGMVMPGRVTKITESQVIVQLSETLSGPVHMIDLADDYAKADPSAYQKNQVVRVCIKNVDIPNKRMNLSMRPSKVLSSSLPVEDAEVSLISQLKTNDIIRGFVKNITDGGLFVKLGSSISAFVRVSDLSDLFLKDWKSNFQIDQLVKGKIIAVDAALNHVQMSLKQSLIDKDYRAPLTYTDMEVGGIVTGKVRKVEEFGVFIVVDGSANVSGLCHRSEMAEGRIPNPKILYNEGDLVKAKILKIDQIKKKISFGLKTSYFIVHTKLDPQEDPALDCLETSIDRIDEQTSDEGDNMNGVELTGIDHKTESSEHSKIEVDKAQSADNDVDTEGNNDVLLPTGILVGSNAAGGFKGLDAGGFDWSGGMIAQYEKGSQPDIEVEGLEPKKPRRRKAEIMFDKTGDLDANGPQSIADFERILMGQPNSSVLWLSYMAYQLELSEIDKAREIAQRALKTINIREESEKLNVWVALLNVENTYGTDESLEEVFKEACQFNDSQDIHERLISIYIQSGKENVRPTLLRSISP